jgi:Spy/CpxP family protein refolding chaperone
MKMYKSIKSRSVLLFILLFAAAAQAQTETAPLKKNRAEGSEMKAKKQKPVPVEDELNLTQKQREQFKKADEDYKIKSKAAKDAKKQDMSQLREERKRAQRAVLNADQAAKYDEHGAQRGKKARSNTTAEESEQSEAGTMRIKPGQRRHEKINQPLIHLATLALRKSRLFNI